MIENQRKKELEKLLTKKQISFCKHYVIDWNGANACRKAGYSENNARIQAVDNLSKPNIREYVEIIKNDYEFLLGISKAKVVEEQIKLAFSSIAHLHNTWIDRKEFEELTEEQKTCIQEIDVKVKKIPKGFDKNGEEITVIVEQIKVKLYDKGKALEALSKMLGYNEPEKVNVQTEDKSPFVGLSFDELYYLKYGKQPKRRNKKSD